MLELIHSASMSYLLTMPPVLRSSQAKQLANISSSHHAISAAESSQEDEPTEASVLRDDEHLQTTYIDLSEEHLIGTNRCDDQSIFDDRYSISSMASRGKNSGLSDSQYKDQLERAESGLANLVTEAPSNLDSLYSWLGSLGLNTANTATTAVWCSTINDARGEGEAAVKQSITRNLMPIEEYKKDPKLKLTREIA